MIAQTTLQVEALAQIQLSTIIAAFIGFAGGLLSRFGLFWIDRRKRKNKLRRAIYAELIAGNWIPRLNQDQVNTLKNRNERPRNTNIPHSVYDSHISDIGLLTLSEINEIVDYYDTVCMAEEELEIMLDPAVKDDHRTREKFVDSTYPRLVASYTSAKESLEECINVPEDVQPEHYSREKPTGDSIQTETN